MIYYHFRLISMSFLNHLSPYGSLAFARQDSIFTHLVIKTDPAQHQSSSFHPVPPQLPPHLYTEGNTIPTTDCLIFKTNMQQIQTQFQSKCLAQLLSSVLQREQLTERTATALDQTARDTPGLRTPHPAYR